jgi:Cu(I)/Ag(I) efflux system membrane fusion protein
MKPAAAGTLAVLLLAAGIAGGYWYGMSEGMKHAAPAPAAAGKADAGVQADSGRKVLYWYDPMYPQQRFDKPGKSPFMDMQLVPKYADEGASEGGVSINPRVAQNLGVRTAAARTGTLERKVEAVGTVAWNERGVVVLQSRTGGFVERLYARAPLDPVAKGAPLVELLVPEWTAAQEEYLALLKSELPGAENLRAAGRQRLVLLGMSEELIQTVERERRAQPRITLRAPIGGVIQALEVREGMTVMPGATLFRIVDLSTVWVNAEVPESLSAAVRPGTPVEARVAAWPGDTFRGRVAAILPEITAETRTMRARIELANPGARLAPGMFASLAFAGPAGRKALLVPTESVIRTGTRTVVILAGEKGMFRPVDVEPGLESGGDTEILKGLAEGDRVVLSGQFLIDSESSLRAALTRMQPPEPAAAAPVPAHRAEGVMVSGDDQFLTIKHGAIPSAGMGAMTMEFKSPPGGLPKGLKAGDAIHFEFVITRDGEFATTKVERGGQPARSEPGAKAADPHAGHGAHK